MQTVGMPCKAFRHEFALVRRLHAHVFLFHLIELFMRVANGGVASSLDRAQGQRTFQVLLLRFDLFLKMESASYLAFFGIECLLQPRLSAGGQLFPGFPQLFR